MYFPKSAVPLNQTPHPAQQPQTGYMPKSAVPVQPEKIPTGIDYWKGLAKNTPKSFVNTLGGVVKAGINIFNPNWDENTLYNMGKLATGVAQKFTPGVQKEEETANQVGQFYKDRYGGWENIKKTAYEDPVGVGLDVATVLQGTGGLLKGGAGLATRGATEVSLASNAAKIGRAGSAISRTGEAINPITQTAKVAGKALSPVSSIAKKGLGSASEYLGSKAQKFNRTNIDAIEEATKMKPLEYARYKNLPIAATEKSVKEMENIIKSKQAPFNSLVKTNTPIDRNILVRELEKTAEKLSTGTRQERSLAMDILDEAAYHKKHLGEPLTDTELTRQITKSFNEASKQQIADPMKSGFSEQFARSGQQTREQIYPGSMAMGQELRGLRTYAEELGKQANTGKGTQFFNVLKPAGAGALAGAGLGSFAPGVGNIVGATIGATASAIANSPQFLAFASDSLNKISKGTVRVPPQYVKLFSRVVGAGQAGRLFTPTSQEIQLIKSIQPELKQNESSDSIIQPSATPYKVPQIRRSR